MLEEQLVCWTSKNLKIPSLSKFVLSLKIFGSTLWIAGSESSFLDEKSNSSVSELLGPPRFDNTTSLVVMTSNIKSIDLASKTDAFTQLNS